MAASADKPKLARPVAGTPLPTVLLLHHLPGGDHYDWMIADPRESGPEGRLWTARVAVPSREWGKLDTWMIEVIGLHRREYLTYEGLISGNRGTVARIDEGVCIAREWSEKRIVVEVRMRDFTGTLLMEAETITRWRVSQLK